MNDERTKLRMQAVLLLIATVAAFVAFFVIGFSLWPDD